jgi:alanine-glyoxylate transaminase / serine-glyoxylate transaminase / serine-pyruvate transaminase
VLQALSRTPIGHLDPLYVDLMGEVQELLRYAWQTDNRLTIPMSGTGSAAMEATLANTIEPGDTVLVAVMGYFGLRLVDMAGRYRANVVTIEKPWGEAFSLAELEAGAGAPTSRPSWPWCMPKPPPASASRWRVSGSCATSTTACCCSTP